MLHIPSPVDLPDPGIELGSPALQAVLYQLSYQGSPYIYIQSLIFTFNKYQMTVK